MKFRSKKIVEAFRLTAQSRLPIMSLYPKSTWFYDSNGPSELYVATFTRGGRCAVEGDFITCDESGDMEIYSPVEFAEKFEPA